MVNPKIGIAIGVAGVTIVLLPILALFLTGGYDSPIQKIYDTPLAPGFSAGILITAAGAATTAIGLLLFVRGMRTLSPYSPPVAPVRRPLKRENSSNSELEEIEREISSMLDEKGPAMEIRTVPPRPARQTAREQQTVVAQPSSNSKTLAVVTKGVDMVCKSCGAVNPIGSKICGSCGAELFEPNPKAVACPVCGAPVDESYKIGENIVCGICFSELKYESIV
ncbi:MAG: zinc ribbon domain-containing protein [Candidatus Caldarchaeum sp.]|nr:zinc ribbon domain-containing protein [Candidatus Caldarchaeum sp.]MDW8434657.1 zinc ribbon domain-containing protein [Candidatus Caldarchaeum sp.]